MGKFLIFSPKFSLIRFFLLVFGMLFLLLSWWRNLSIESEKSVLFLVDNSLSMTVQDISSDSGELFSRLDTSKKFLKNFVEKFYYPFSLVIFSREITLETPFTTDKTLISNVISGITLMTYGGGSNILLAIENTVNIYKTRPNTHIVVLSDMETFDEMVHFPTIPPNISLTFVGIGTEQGGLMLEGYTTTGQPSYRQFEGKNAISRLDRKTLETLAQRFSSDFYIINKTSDFSMIQDQIMQKNLITSSGFDYFRIFGIIFLLIGIFFPMYKILKNEKKS